MFVAQKQSLLVCFLTACRDIVELLNPDDNDHSHLYSERLSSAECKEFERQFMSGTKSLRFIKEEIRATLQTITIVIKSKQPTLFNNQTTFFLHCKNMCARVCKIKTSNENSAFLFQLTTFNTDIY